MLEVDPTGLGRRLSSSEACHFRCRSAEGKILPRTRLRWVRDTFGCEGIDRTICPLFEMRRPLLAFGSETAGQATRIREARRGYTQSIIVTSCRRKPRCNLDQIARFYGNARTCHQRRLSRRKPAAACWTHAFRMHIIRRMQLVCSQASPNRLENAVLCLESTCEHLDARLPSKHAGAKEY